MTWGPGHVLKGTERETSSATKGPDDSTIAYSFRHSTCFERHTLATDFTVFLYNILQLLRTNSSFQRGQVARTLLDGSDVAFDHFGVQAAERAQLDVSRQALRIQR
jgi:hypothetical protein